MAEDFTALITKMLGEGKTPEQIAEIMTKSLNEVQKHKAEADVKMAREKAILNYKNMFFDAMDRRSLTLSNLARGIAVCLATKNSKAGDLVKTAEDMENFAALCERTISDIPVTFEVWKKVEPTISKLDEAKSNVSADVDIVGEFLKSLFGR